MSKENVEVVRRAYELVARGDMDHLAAFAREHLHPDYEYQSDLAGETFRGVEGALAFVTDVRESFEDYTTEIEENGRRGRRHLGRVAPVGPRSGERPPHALARPRRMDLRRRKGGAGRAFSSRAYALEAVGLRE